MISSVGLLLLRRKCCGIFGFDRFNGCLWQFKAIESCDAFYCLDGTIDTSSCQQPWHRFIDKQKVQQHKYAGYVKHSQHHTEIMLKHYGNTEQQRTNRYSQCQCYVAVNAIPFIEQLNYKYIKSRKRIRWWFKELKLKKRTKMCIWSMIGWLVGKSIFDRSIQILTMQYIG